MENRVKKIEKRLASLETLMHADGSKQRSSISSFCINTSKCCCCTAMISIMILIIAIIALVIISIYKGDEIITKLK